MSELIGRLHPLVVHLPIGILTLAFLIEIASRKARFVHLKSALSFVLLIAALTSLVAVFTGWIMPKEGEFDEDLINLHFYFSISLTISTIIVYGLFLKRETKWGKLYFPMLSLTMLLLTVTGHYGGSLTHGSDFLTAPLEKEELSKVADVNTLIAYAGVIEPILKKKCFSCHNKGKQKGGLLMSTVAGLKKGGDEGPVFVAGSAANSSLIERLHLPKEDKKHMPPTGKLQVSKNEIKLLEWWIEEGASFDKKVGNLQQSEQITAILKSYEEDEFAINTHDLEIIDEETIVDLQYSGINIIPHGAENLLVKINLSRDTLLTKKKFKQLKSIADNIIQLDLSSSNMNDDLMGYLSSFKNLITLRLQNTSITSKGLQSLEELEHLQSLNLYGTKIDDKAFGILKKIEPLNALYLWQTDVTKEAIQAYSLAKPVVKISHQVAESIFGNVQLKAPKITAEKDIFDDTLRINLSFSFRNVSVFYTLDGSTPDSTSLKYETPFLIDKTTVVKAITVKEGWLISDISERLFMKAGHQIAAIQLKSKPNEKYRPENEKSLIDFEKGTENFQDGKWSGYFGKDLKMVLDLGEAKKVNSVTVNALEDTNSYIFYPKGIIISTSIDGKKYIPVKEIILPIAKEGHDAETKSFLVNFDSTEARFVQLNVLGTQKNPKWHAAPDATNWLFVDEIMLN